MSEAHPDMHDVEAILADPRSSKFLQLRDRAAYVYLTGSFPKHLRVFFTRVLVLISKPTPDLTTAVEVTGGIAIDTDIAMRLRLEEHPMVAMVHRYVQDGYKIRVSRGANARKPFSKIWLFKGADQVTVQIDGSWKDHWD